jgi:porphobilinogen synthase
MTFPANRMRRMRRGEPLRALVRETALDPGDLIYPLFICPGKGVRNPVSFHARRFQSVGGRSGARG